MSETKEVKKWWLYDVTTQDHGEILVAFQHHKNIKGSIEVVEASALDAANAEIEKLKAECAQLKEYKYMYEGLCK